MSKLHLGMAEFLFPPKMRPYWTFRSATAVALLVSFASALVRVLVRFPPERIAEWQSRNLFHSPRSLGLYYLFVAIVLYLVYATRDRARWYVWRVWVYSMVLTGALIGLLNLILPSRASLMMAGSSR